MIVLEHALCTPECVLMTCSSGIVLMIQRHARASSSLIQAGTVQIQNSLPQRPGRAQAPENTLTPDCRLLLTTGLMPDSTSLAGSSTQREGNMLTAGQMPGPTLGPDCLPMSGSSQAAGATSHNSPCPISLIFRAIQPKPVQPGM